MRSVRRTIARLPAKVVPARLPRNQLLRCPPLARNTTEERIDQVEQTLNWRVHLVEKLWSEPVEDPDDPSPLEQQGGWEIECSSNRRCHQSNFAEVVDPRSDNVELQK
jgi:hypothetical protein